MSLSFVVVGSQIRRFKMVIKSLAAIGSQLLIEGMPEKLILRAINSAHSAFLAVSLSAAFFESYNVFSTRGVVQAGVTIKHLLATFRSVRVSSMSLDLNEQSATLRVALRCENGLLKRYGLDLNRSDILQANLDAQGLPVAVVAEAGELNKLLNTFQSTLDEVTIIALPEPALGGTLGQAAAQRCVRLQSFIDPAKAAGAKALHTSMSLDASHVFRSYSNSCAAPSDVTINLKDLRALVGLCVELGADVVLRFDEAGVPLLAAPHVPNAREMDYGAELILSTLQESVNPEDDSTAAWGGQQQQQQYANGARSHGQPAAAAARVHADHAETILAATTAGNGLAAGVRGPSAAETPQGGSGAAAAARAAASGGGVISFRQQQQQQQQPPPGSGGGGRSGGHARSGGGGARWEQLEAELAAEEAQQQQARARQQQHQQQQQQDWQQHEQQQQQQVRQPVPAFAATPPPAAAAAYQQQAVGGMASPDDVSALPGRRRSPAPAAALQQQQQQWPQQAALDSHHPHPHHEQQQQPDEAMPLVEEDPAAGCCYDDEELPSTPPDATAGGGGGAGGSHEGMQDGGAEEDLGCL